MSKEMTKDAKPKRKTKLERTTEAQLFLEQDELQKQLEAEEHDAPEHECKPTEVHEQHTIMREQHIVRRLRKL